MVASPAARGDPGVSETDSGSMSVLRPVMAAVFVILPVVAVGLAVYFSSRLGEVESNLDARGDAVQAAERFTVQVNNYDSNSVADYQESVASMLSTKFRDEFDKAMTDIVASVREAKMVSTGNVLASGVASLDQDSARVLVVADASVKTVFDNRERHFRWEVALVKVDGQWLVDDFTPVA